MHRRIIDARTGEVPVIRCVIAGVGVIGSHIDRVCRHCYRRREVHLLPSRCGLVRESRRSEQLPGGGPQVANMRAGVGSSLVEADPGDKAIQIGLKLNPKLDCVRVVNRRVGRRGRNVPDTTWTRRRRCGSKRPGLI